MYVKVDGRYPYFPAVELRARNTPFKSHQVEYPDLYKNYEGVGVIYRIDCLECLRDLLPVDNANLRSKIYTMLSGDCTDEELSQLLTRFYKESPHFRNYVDEVFVSCPKYLLKRIVLPLRERIDSYYEQVYDICKQKKGKYLMRTHDYILIKFDYEILLPFELVSIDNR